MYIYQCVPFKIICIYISIYIYLFKMITIFSNILVLPFIHQFQLSTAQQVHYILPLITIFNISDLFHPPQTSDSSYCQDSLQTNFTSIPQRQSKKKKKLHQHIYHQDDKSSLDPTHPLFLLHGTECLSLYPILCHLSEFLLHSYLIFLLFLQRLSYLQCVLAISIYTCYIHFHLKHICTSFWYNSMYLVDVGSVCMCILCTFTQLGLSGLRFFHSSGVSSA